jgi:hypothetical protein
MKLVQKITNWVKTHKFSTVLLLIIGFLLIKGCMPRMRLARHFNSMSTEIMPNAMYKEAVSVSSLGRGGSTVSYAPAAPQLEVTDRQVVRTSTMSLLVKDVRETITNIQTITTEGSGYTVTTNIHEGDGTTTGYISIRVPTAQLDQTLESLRGLAVKVVSENISGQDITDEYIDAQERLRILAKTKGIYEEILDEATEVDDILRIQEKMLRVQSQMDTLRGQLKYMSATASSALISITVSTDELSLPYMPDNAWRPKVVVKYAVRSLLTHLQKLGSLGIWVIIYGVVWIPLVLFVIIVKRRRQGRMKGSSKK